MPSDLQVQLVPKEHGLLRECVEKASPFPASWLQTETKGASVLLGGSKKALAQEQHHPLDQKKATERDAE